MSSFYWEPEPQAREVVRLRVRLTEYRVEAWRFDRSRRQYDATGETVAEFVDGPGELLGSAPIGVPLNPDHPVVQRYPHLLDTLQMMST